MPVRFAARAMIRALACLSLALVVGGIPSARSQFTTQPPSPALCQPFAGFPLSINLGGGGPGASGESYACAFNKIQQALGMRGQPNGLAGLGPDGRLLPTNLPVGLAPLASPTFTGTVSAPAVSLNGADLSALLNGKAPTASPTFTGTATAPAFAVTGSGSTGDLSGTSAKIMGDGTRLRSLADRAKDRISVLDFVGVDNTATTSSLSGLATAVSTVRALGATAELFFPCGTYLISGGTLYVPGSYNSLKGASSECVVIRNGNANAPAIQLGAAGRTDFDFSNSISGMLFVGGPGVTGVAGQLGLLVNYQAQYRIADIRTGAFPTKLYDGVSIRNTSQGFADAIMIQDVTHDGFSCFGSDLNGSNMRSDANGNDGYAFRYCKGMYLSNITGFGNGGHAVAFYDDPAGPSSNNFFLNLCADSSGSDNLYMENLQTTMFANTWTSTNKDQLVNKYASGLHARGGKVYDITFSNLTAIYNNFAGVLLDSADTNFPARISITNPLFGTPPPPGVAATGFGNGASSIDGRTGPGGYGIFVGGGSMTIVGGSFTGNATAPFYVDPAADVRISGSKGVSNTLLGTLTVGASPWTYKTGVGEETLCLSGGTVSTVKSSGFTLLTSSNACIPLDANRTVIVTYTAAPTVTALRR